MNKEIKFTKYQGENKGFAIVADSFPIFAFGKTNKIAQERFKRACKAYFNGAFV